jgi:3-oxoacyl-[acyl-carrier protein] reductase
MEDKLLAGKNSIITGCTRGIGRSILKSFVTNGSNVFACVRKQAEEFDSFCRELSASNNVRIVPICFDLSDKNTMKEAVKKITGEKLPIDILVNNAGITYNALFQMSSAEKMQEIFDVNFFAPILFTQYVVKLMLRNKQGSIVNIASSAGIDGNKGRSIYGASKAALICATKVIAAELGEFGIRANAIAPGITRTDMLSSSMTEEIIQETILNTSMERAGEPDDIAKVTLFLASDLSSYVTGQAIRVDGGL